MFGVFEILHGIQNLAGQTKVYHISDSSTNGLFSIRLAMGHIHLELGTTSLSTTSEADPLLLADALTDTFHKVGRIAQTFMINVLQALVELLEVRPRVHRSIHQTACN